MTDVHIRGWRGTAWVLLCMMALGFLLGPGLPAAWAGTEFQWTWMKGSSSLLGAAAYGTLGVTVATNTPGARQPAAFWKDNSGLLWVFGGDGKDNTGALGYLNDLWKYDQTTGYWTWMKGSSTKNATGSYGTLGVAASPNHPGARWNATSWTDSSGSLWLLGGQGYDRAGALGYLNDLWKFNTSNARWAWMKGSTLIGQKGTYGSLGTPAAGNTPGARSDAGTWADSSGNLWLFGGFGLDGTGTSQVLSDLWKYEASSGNWVWMKGSSLAEAAGVYGERTKFASGNVPGGRYGAVSWKDSAGGMWLFGGYGRDSAGAAGRLNDLWKYDPSSGNWAWMKGATTVNALGVYGTRYVAADGNCPGARNSSAAWFDPSGALWLFGGFGYGDFGDPGQCNDLWKYSIATGFWTWIKGVSWVNGRPTYGTLGTPEDANTPGGRSNAASWFDSSGALWLFGGYAVDGSGNSADHNDLWRGSFPDTAPPTGTVVINNNRSVTNSANVTLALTWDDGGGSGVVRMKFSNDAVTWTAWESLAVTKAWTLAAGEGHKTVRVMFRDKAGNNSTVYKDYIRVDTTPPTGSILINSGASSTKSRNVSLGLTWSDGTGAGVTRMRFSIDGMHWTAWEPPVTPKSYTLPSTPKYYTVRVQYLDGGNNYSAVFSDYIKLIAP